jgi:protein-disulfide isomerase
MKRAALVWSVVVALSGSGCGGAARVDALDAQLRSQHDAAARHDADVDARLQALEARLDRLAKALPEAAEGSVGGARSTEERLADLDARLNDLDTRVRRPPPKPHAAPDGSTVFSIAVGDSPQQGPAKAAVTIVMGFEFACPYCEKVRATLDELRQRYGSKLRIVYKTFIVHPQVATDASLAACAAHRQKKFFEMHDVIWSKAFPSRHLDAAYMRELAAGLGLDMGRYDTDIGPTCRSVIDADQAALAAIGQRGTPTFYINGRYLSGAQPIEVFAAIIDEELAKAEAAFKRGTKPAKYYEGIVRDGKKTYDAPAT